MNRPVAVLATLLATLLVACSSAPPPSPAGDPAQPAPAAKKPIDRTPPPPLETAPVDGIEHWASPTRTAAQFIEAANARGYAKGRVVRVSTIEQLVAALAPNTTIMLAPGRYEFADSNKLGDEADKERLPDWSALSPHYNKDGEIHDIDNLALIGEGPEPSIILQPDGYAHALSFFRADTIALFNLVVGHRPEKGWCRGGVIKVVEGSDILISDSTLFGSGTEGLTLITVTGLSLENSVITDTTEQLSTLSHSRDIRYDNVRIVGNRGDLLRGFAVFRSELLLANTIIAENKQFPLTSTPPNGSDSVLFWIDSNYDIGKWHVDAPKQLDPPVARSRVELRQVKIDGQTINKVL